MKLWPFNRQEKRESLARILTEAQYGHLVGTGTGVRKTAVATACATIWQRAFESAVAVGAESYVTPVHLGLIARMLIERGEIVFEVRTDGREPVLRVASSHTVLETEDGEPAYRLTIPGPSRSLRTVELTGDRVCHCTWSTTAQEPWRGVGPWESAALTSDAYERLQDHIRQQASMSFGQLVSLPVSTDKLPAAREQLAENRGRLSLMTTTERASAGDLQPWSFGPEPHPSIVALELQLAREICAAAGVPAQLVSLGGGGNSGSERREAWRAFLSGSVAALGRRVSGELTMKLGTDIKLDWRELKSTDISSRARAMKALLEAGLSLQQSLELTGLHE